MQRGCCSRSLPPTDVNVSPAFGFLALKKKKFADGRQTRSLVVAGLQIFLLWMTHPSPRCSTAEGVQCCINPLRAHPPTVTTVHTLSEGRSAHELAERQRRRRRARERAANVRLTKSAVFKVRLKMLRKSKKEGEKKNPTACFSLSASAALYI